MVIHKRKVLFLVLILALIGVVSAFCVRKDRPHYAVVPVYYSTFSDLPLIDVEIESHQCRMMLDTGADGYITLREEILNELKEKDPKGVCSFSDIKGNRYEEPRFLIPRIKIMNFKASPILAMRESIQFSSEGVYVGSPDPAKIESKMKSLDGRVGMKLFENFCLYVDLRNSVIYIAEDEDALKKKGGFSLEDFVEVPLLSNEDHAMVIFETDRGPAKFLLDTGADLSIWNDPDAVYLSSFTMNQLLVNGEVIGSQKFFNLKLDSQFEINGILGVDFFKEHAVFIDMKHKRAAISK